MTPGQRRDDYERLEVEESKDVSNKLYGERIESDGRVGHQGRSPPRILDYKEKLRLLVVGKRGFLAKKQSERDGRGRCTATTTTQELVGNGQL